MAGKKAEDKKTLEENLGKIEELTQKLSSGNISLDEAFNIYKESMDLIRVCESEIDEVEKQLINYDKVGVKSEDKK